jgi:hypothetical protein
VCVEVLELWGSSILFMTQTTCSDISNPRCTGCVNGHTSQDKNITVTQSLGYLSGRNTVYLFAKNTHPTIKDSRNAKELFLERWAGLAARLRMRGGGRQR